MKMHALRDEYNHQVNRRYHVRIGGDKDPERTELAAVRICALGIPFELFIDLALRIWEPYSKRMGWKYPYFSTVVGEKSIQRVKELLEYNDVTLAKDHSQEFEEEVIFATEYIHWMQGQLDHKPVRELDVGLDIRNQVSRYLCQLFGVPPTDNYNSIALEIQRGS